MVVCGQNARFWDVKDRRVLRDIVVPAVNTWRYRWFFSSDAKKLAFIDAWTVRIFDPATGREFHPLEGHTDIVDQLLVSPDGKSLFSKARSDHHAHFWDMAAGNLLRSVNVPKISVGCPSFSSDSKLIANPDDEGRIQVWDVSNGKEVKQFAAPGKFNQDALEGMDCHFSSDMKTMAAMGMTSTAPTPVLIWDVERGNLTTFRELPTDGNGCFSADNRLLALDLTEASGGHFLLLQDAASGRTLFRIRSEDIVHLAFSPDSKTLAGIRHKKPQKVPSVAEICIWEVATGKERMRFETTGQMMFAWSLDRRRIATVDFHSCSVWNAVTGQEIFKSSSERIGDFWSFTFHRMPRRS
jgi:WD40 repeat protein